MFFLYKTKMWLNSLPQHLLNFISRWLDTTSCLQFVQADTYIYRQKHWLIRSFSAIKYKNKDKNIIQYHNPRIKQYMNTKGFEQIRPLQSYWYFNLGAWFNRNPSCLLFLNKLVNLQELHLVGYRVCMYDIQRMTLPKTLTTLRIEPDFWFRSGGGLTTSALSDFFEKTKSLPKLQKLFLKENDLQYNNSYKHIQWNPNLLHLEIFLGIMNPRQLRTLPPFENSLESLSISGNYHFSNVDPEHPEHGDFFEKLPNKLKHLKISDMAISIDIKLKVLQNLVSLSLKNIKAVKEIDFNQLKTLEELHISDITFNAFWDISNMTKAWQLHQTLKCLDISYNKFKDGTMVDLSMLQKLQTLNMNNTLWKDTEIILKFPNSLKKLCFQGNFLTQEKLMELQLPSGLEILDAASNKLCHTASNKSFNAIDLQHLQHLKVLNLGQNNIDDRFLEQSILPPNLQVLILSNNYIRLKPNVNIVFPRHLRELYFDNNEIQSNGFYSFLELRNLPIGLQHVNFEYNNIYDHDCFGSSYSIPLSITQISVKRGNNVTSKNLDSSIFV